MNRLSTTFVVCSLGVVLVGCVPAPVSGFKPIYPEITTGQTLGGKPVLRFVTVDSLQPTLKWERIATNGRRVAYVSIDLNDYQDLRFELVIWKEVNGARGDVVYRAEGLMDNEHTVREPLDPATVYYWSVRATFNTDAGRRITEWSISEFPCMPDMRDTTNFEEFQRQICGRELARVTGSIHPAHYYRFKTPAS